MLRTASPPKGKKNLQNCRSEKGPKKEMCPKGSNRAELPEGGETHHGERKERLGGKEKESKEEKKATKKIPFSGGKKKAKGGKSQRVCHA